MTEIDFYILDAAAPDADLIFVCRLAEKAVGLGRNVLIRPRTRGDARRLDELLWTYSQGSFLPHRLVSDAGAAPIEPVLIDDGPGPVGDPTVGRWDLLINLAADVPDYFSRYARLAEIVDGARREDGRERFRFYRDRGYALKTHQIRV